MEYGVCMWYLGERRSGHLFFEKLGVRTVAASKQSPHLLLPLTSFGPQGHKIPAEIQPRISSDERAIYRAICDSSGQNKIHLWMASTSDHQALETDSTYTEFLHGTDGQEKNPVIKRETIGKTEKEDGHYSTQCTMNSLFAITSLNAGGQQSNSWGNRARC